MLTFYYESGNDSVALSEKSVSSKIESYVNFYKEDCANNCEFIISQISAINAIGSLIFNQKIIHSEVSIIIEDLNKELLFDEYGSLIESWYTVVPSYDY